MSLKHLFSRSLEAAPERLHMAAHSHHLWPDASFDAQQQAWLDAAHLADRKWDKIMDEVWPEAQRHVAAELNGAADRIVFSSNTHDFLIRLLAAVPAQGPVRILTSDGEFHSARRQFARWEEEGLALVTRVPAEEWASALREQIAALHAGGVDLLILETFGYLDELVEAVHVASEFDLPVVAQATFADDGLTLSGHTPAEVGSTLDPLPVDVIGVNCTLGPRKLVPIVAGVAAATSAPLSVQPNAGQPQRLVTERCFG